MNRSKLLNKVANYFKEWNGYDKNAPTMEITIDDLREIASMNVERCSLRQENKSMRTQYRVGIKVNREGLDESDGIFCPVCGYEVARNDDFDEMRPKHCPDCGTKLIY